MKNIGTNYLKAFLAFIAFWAILAITGVVPTFLDIYFINAPYSLKKK